MVCNFLNMRSGPYHLNTRTELVFHTTSEPDCPGPATTYLNVITEAILMASVGRHQIGSPPLGTPIYMSRKQVRLHQAGTPSRITSCLKPNLLETANAHISVPTADTQLAWGSQNQQQPALLKSQISRFPEVGSPLLGN